MAESRVSQQPRKSGRYPALPRVCRWLRTASPGRHVRLPGWLVVLALILALPAGAEIAELQVLATTDLHAHLDRGEGEENSGGWLRVATLIRQRREAAGSEKTLLVDCGDTVEGTFIGLVSRGEVALDLLKALKYDVWVPGNHEFDFGTSRLREIFTSMSGPLLCGNLELGTTASRPLTFPAWRMFEKQGVRVAVIGATASYLDQWLWGKDLAGYRVEPALDMLRRVMPDVHKAKADVIILAIHQGWLFKDPRGVNELPAIVRRFPEIDLVLGGHTHQTVPGEKIGFRTWYVQPGYCGSHLAVVRVKVDTAKHAVIDIESELLPAAATVPFDPEAERVVQGWERKTANAGWVPAGTLKNEISATGTPGENCGTSELICQAIAAATGAQVVLHGKLTMVSLPAGRISTAKLFALIPFENSIGVAWLAPADLRRVIAEQYGERGTASYNGVWGVQVTVDHQGQVTELRWPDGRPLAADVRIKVAANSYVIAGGGGRNPILREMVRAPAAKLEDTGVNSRDAVLEFLRTHPDCTLTPRRWVQTEPDAAPVKQEPLSGL